MAVESIDIPTIKDKLYEKLKPSGWADILKTFMFSQDMDNILKKLYKESSGGFRFTPPLKQTFRVFEECPWKNLRIVFLGQDPYPQIGVADGMAFSCSNTGKSELALTNIFQQINETVTPPHLKVDNPAPDLSRWARQGILLLNSSLSTRIGEIGSHYEIWKPFINFVISEISCRNWAGMIFVFFGKKAEEFSDLIDSNHYKFFVPHPCSSRFNYTNKWDCKNIFNEINDLLNCDFENKITW